MKKGFSLIELIVAVSIVAVATAIGVTSFGSTNAKARDSRRLADMEKVRVALEMYKQVNGTYPAASSGAPTDLSPTYLQSYPTDPKGYTYYYQRQTNYTYYLFGYMEDVGSTNGTYSNLCGAPGVCNYRATNP